MAAKKVKKRVKRERNLEVRKVMAGVSLLAFMVIFIASFRSALTLDDCVRAFYTVALRAAGIMCLIWLGNVVVIKVLNTYEEKGSGQN